MSLYWVHYTPSIRNFTLRRLQVKVMLRSAKYVFPKNCSGRSVCARWKAWKAAAYCSLKKQSGIRRTHNRTSGAPTMALHYQTHVPNSITRRLLIKMQLQQGWKRNFGVPLMRFGFVLSFSLPHLDVFWDATRSRDVPLYIYTRVLHRPLSRSWQRLSRSAVIIESSGWRFIV